MKKGLLLVISGPAGTGKSQVCKHLLNTGEYKFSVSATTRAPRPDEIPDVNYHYISRTEFVSRLKAGDLIEHTEYCGNYYGTLKKETEDTLASGKNLLLDIEVEGARRIKAKYPDAVLIFLLPPDYATQEKRLRGRGTEPEEKILERLERAKEELKYVGCYDYVVYNHDCKDKEAAAQILSIVDAERAAIKRNPDIAKKYFS